MVILSTDAAGNVIADETPPAITGRMTGLVASGAPDGLQFPEAVQSVFVPCQVFVTAAPAAGSHAAAASPKRLAVADGDEKVGL